MHMRMLEPNALMSDVRDLNFDKINCTQGKRVCKNKKSKKKCGAYNGEVAEGLESLVLTRLHEAALGGRGARG